RITTRSRGAGGPSAVAWCPARRGSGRWCAAVRRACLSTAAAARGRSFGWVGALGWRAPPCILTGQGGEHSPPLHSVARTLRTATAAVRAGSGRTAGLGGRRAVVRAAESSAAERGGGRLLSG